MVKNDTDMQKIDKTNEKDRCIINFKEVLI